MKNGELEGSSFEKEELKDCMVDSRQNLHNLLLYKDVFDQTNQFIAILENDLTIKHVNPAMLNILEMTEEELEGIPYWELSLWEHSEELQNKIMFSLEMIYQGEEVQFETNYPQKNGMIRDIDFTIRPIFNQEEEIEMLITMGYDVTESKKTESALHKKENEIRMFFDYATSGFFIRRLDEGVYLPEDEQTLSEVYQYTRDREVITNYNQALCDAVGVLTEAIESKNFMDIFSMSSQKREGLWKKAVKEGHSEFETKIIVKNKPRYLHGMIAPFIENGNFYQGIFGIVRDVTEKYLIEEQLRFFATKDTLTKVNNRRSFLENATTIFEQRKAQGIVSPVLMMDIDNFKRVNDTYGHSGGDEVLIAFAQSCEKIIGDQGILGRMGGEEFAAVLQTSLEEGLEIAKELCLKTEALDIMYDDTKIHFTVSIGIVLQDTKSFDEALKNSDIALYKAKNSGKNKVLVYCEEKI